MQQATIRFYAELNDFIPPERRGQGLTVRFHVSPAVKDVIESLGVPHTEVDLILINGRSVGFAEPVHDGDRVAVYPMFESMDISPLLRLRAEPLRVTRFVLDVHLGRLARYLRMLGFDTAYRSDAADEELAEISREQRRILLTRDTGLLKRGCVTHGYFVRATQPRQQLIEVVERFDLRASAKPFTRCLRCNGNLTPVAPEQVVDRLPEGVSCRFSRFWQCVGCDQVYWEGSHYQRMRRWANEVLDRGDRMPVSQPDMKIRVRADDSREARMTGVTPDYGADPAREVYVARQPIFTASRELYAYELLYRSSTVNAYDGEDPNVATSRVITNTYFNIGLDRLVGKHRSFINFDRQMLIGGEAESLAGPSVVIEILETVEPDAEVLEACRRIKKKGSMLALDDFACAGGFVPLLELADIVKVDVQAEDPGEIAARVRAVPGAPRLLLAEKVESDAEFQRGLKLGYSLFQGYFLGRPQIVASTRLPKRD